MLGKDPDPLLQADDIIYLPTSNIKSAIVSGGLNLLVNVVNLGAYRHDPLIESRPVDTIPHPKSHPYTPTLESDHV